MYVYHYIFITVGLWKAYLHQCCVSSIALLLNCTGCGEIIFSTSFFYYSSTLLSPWLLAQYSPSNKNKITMVISRQHFDSRGEPQAITYYLILQLAIKTSPSTSFRFKIKVKLPQNHCTCDDIYAKLSEYIFRNERKRNLLVQGRAGLLRHRVRPDK